MCLELDICHQLRYQAGACTSSLSAAFREAGANAFSPVWPRCWGDVGQTAASYGSAARVQEWCHLLPLHVHPQCLSMKFRGEILLLTALSGGESLMRSSNKIDK